MQYYNVCMTASQQTLGFAPAPYKTRKARFLEEMERIVPWAQLLALIAPYYPPEGKRALGGRPAYPLEVMLRVHCLQQRTGAHRGLHGSERARHQRGRPCCCTDRRNASEVMRATKA